MTGPPKRATREGEPANGQVYFCWFNGQQAAAADLEHADEWGRELRGRNPDLGEATAPSFAEGDRAVHLHDPVELWLEHPIACGTTRRASPPQWLPPG